MALSKKTGSSQKIKNFDKNGVEDAKPTHITTGIYYEFYKKALIVRQKSTAC